MSIFKRKTKFVAAICPECKGHLQLNSNLEVAYCQYCGAQCIVENAPKTKKGKLETVLGFVERQQEIRRKDKEEKRKRKEEERRREEERLKKTWWIGVLVLVGIVVFSVAMAILDNQGII